MTTRKRFELDILCPNCGATGNARVSENEGADTAEIAFRVEGYPPGFCEERPSASRHETLIACSCGQVFYLL